jgi:hypothetical protein
MVAAVKSPEEIKNDLERKEESPEQKVEKLDDPKLKRDYEFKIDYTDGRGRRWKGPFTNRILNFDELSRVGIIKANLFGGMPIISFDAYTVDHNEKVSHLTVSLVSRPDWCEGAKLTKLTDKDLLDAIYSEVASHEATFHGRGSDQEAGDSGSGDVKG